MVPTRLRDAVYQVFPIFLWLPTYDLKSNLFGDIVAGFSVTAVAAPEAVSYAAIAGLPADQGLYTGFLAPLAYSLFGSSPHLIVGPTAIMCVLTDSAIPATWGGQPVGGRTPGSDPDQRVALAALLCAVVAALHLLMALLRVGGLVSLVSMPVVAGFTTGSALITASSQFSSLLGLAKCVTGDGTGSCTFPEAVLWVCERVGDVRWGPVVLAVSSLALLLTFKFGLPRVLPAGWAPFVSSLGPLALVAVSVPVVTAFGSEFAAAGIVPPAPIPPGLPMPRWPVNDLTAGGSAGDWAGLVARAVPLAIVAYLSAMTIAKTVARQNGPYAVDPASELVAQAAASAACAIGMGLPVSGSFSRTSVNVASGARSGMASLLSGLFMALALEVATGPLGRIPTVARAAVVIVAILKMVELHLLPALWASDVRDAISFGFTVIAVTCWDPSLGLLAGVVVSGALALLRTTAEPSGAALLAWGGGNDSAYSSAVSAVLPHMLLSSVSSISSSTYGPLSRSSGIGNSAPSHAPYSTMVVAAAGSPAASGGGDAVRSVWRPTDATAAAEEVETAAATAATAAAAVHRSFEPLLLVLRLGPDLQFANAARVSERVHEAVELWAPDVLLLDCSGVGSADTTGAAALCEAVEDVATTQTTRQSARWAAVGASSSRLTGCVVIAAGLPRSAAFVVASIAGRSSPSTKQRATSSTSRVALSESSSATECAMSCLFAPPSNGSTAVNEAGPYLEFDAADPVLGGFTRWTRAGRLLLLAHTMEDGCAAAHAVCKVLHSSSSSNKAAKRIQADTQTSLLADNGGDDDDGTLSSSSVAMHSSSSSSSASSAAAPHRRACPVPPSPLSIALKRERGRRALKNMRTGQPCDDDVRFNFSVSSPAGSVHSSSGAGRRSVGSPTFAPLPTTAAAGPAAGRGGAASRRLSNSAPLLAESSFDAIHVHPLSSNGVQEEEEEEEEEAPRRGRACIGGSACSVISASVRDVSNYFDPAAPLFEPLR